jgi:hypothetical protein
MFLDGKPRRLIGRVKPGAFRRSPSAISGRPDGRLTPSHGGQILEDLLVSHGELDVLERQLEARDPDVRLMLQVRDDAPGAFEALVQRYQDRLVGILYHLVGSLEEAEDLSQDVFLRIYKARKGYRPRYP